MLQYCLFSTVAQCCSQYFVLPKMTPEGYRVSVFCMQSADVSSSDFNLRLNAIKVLSSFDVRLLEETYWAGDIIVLNCKHFGLKHLQSVATLPLLKKYIHCANVSHSQLLWVGDIIILYCKNFLLKHLQSIAILPLLKNYRNTWCWKFLEPSFYILSGSSVIINKGRPGGGRGAGKSS